MKYLIRKEDKAIAKQINPEPNITREEKKRRNLINEERVQERKNSAPSKGEQAVIDTLKKYKVRHTREFFVKAVNNSGWRLFFDFYLRDYKTVIEFDGAQHYNPVYGQDALDRQQRNDWKKDELAKLVGLRMLRIRYDQINKAEQIILDFLKGICPKKEKAQKYHIQTFGYLPKPTNSRS